MRKNLINSAAVLFMGIAAVGCSNDVSDYDVSADLQAQAKSSFPVENIDPNQDWNMAAYRTATINVGGDASKTYDVYVFSELPTSGEATPTLASQKGVKGGTSLQLSFDVAKAQETVYIGRNGEDGMLIKPVTLSGDAYSIDFSSSAVRTRSFAEKATEMTGNPFSSVAAPSDECFKTSVPKGALENKVKNSDNYTTADNVVITQDATLSYGANKVPAGIYISGNVTLGANAQNDSNPGTTVNIYVVRGSTLTINKYSTNFMRTNFYVAEGAKLIVKNESLSAGGSYPADGDWTWYDGKAYNNNEINIYNRGTLAISVSELNIGNGSMIYNEGTLTASSLKFASGAAATYRGMLINKGTVDVTGDVTMNSNCSLLNDSYMHVRGTVSADQYTIWFVNTGNMTVDKDMYVRAGNYNFYNGCQILVKQTLNLDEGSGDGAFNLLSDGAFYCTDLVVCNQCIRLGSRAALVVTGTSTFRAQGGAIYQGFKGTKGTGSENALVVLGTVKFEDKNGNKHNQSKSLCAEGKLLLTADNQAEIVALQGSTNGDMVVVVSDDVTWTTEGSYTITPNTSETEGCLSWTPKKDTETKTEQVVYTYGFEDMLLGDHSDYDFNDVVLYVTTPDANGDVKVTLEAAGATRQIAVMFKDQTTQEVTMLWEEVHTTLGVGETTMVNTGNGTVTLSNDAPSQTIHVGSSLDDNGDFYIVVDGTMEVHIPKYTAGFVNGNTPYAIQVPVKWKWPTETTPVTESYSNFASWAEDVDTNEDWYKKGEITNVYTK